LGNGWKLKAVYCMNRKIQDDLIFEAAEELVNAGIPLDTLVKYKPNLVSAIYNTLTTEQKNLFDQCLVIEPGSPTLKLEEPKRVK
jgi:hypothetical protein